MQIEISASNLPDLLDCAALLQLHSLLDQCSAFIVKRLCFANAAYVYSLADRYSMRSVLDAFARLVRRHFASFAADHRELFFALPASFLVALLDSDEVRRTSN